MTKENSNETPAKGLGFVSILTLIFITLKLCKVIDWSWWWVTSPTWISASFTFLVIAIALHLKGKREREKIERSKVLNQKLRDLNKE